MQLWNRSTLFGTLIGETLSFCAIPRVVFQGDANVLLLFFLSSFRLESFSSHNGGVCSECMVWGVGNVGRLRGSRGATIIADFFKV